MSTGSHEWEVVDTDALLRRDLVALTDRFSQLDGKVQNISKSSQIDQKRLTHSLEEQQSGQSEQISTLSRQFLRLESRYSEITETLRAVTREGKKSARSVEKLSAANGKLTSENAKLKSSVARLTKEVNTLEQKDLLMDRRFNSLKDFTKKLVESPRKARVDGTDSKEDVSNIVDEIDSRDISVRTASPCEIMQPTVDIMYLTGEIMQVRTDLAATQTEVDDLRSNQESSTWNLSELEREVVQVKLGVRQPKSGQDRWSQLRTDLTGLTDLVHSQARTTSADLAVLSTAMLEARDDVAALRVECAGGVVQRRDENIYAWLATLQDRLGQLESALLREVRANNVREDQDRQEKANIRAAVDHLSDEFLRDCTLGKRSPRIDDFDTEFDLEGPPQKRTKLKGAYDADAGLCDPGGAGATELSWQPEEKRGEEKAVDDVDSSDVLSSPIFNRLVIGPDFYARAQCGFEARSLDDEEWATLLRACEEQWRTMFPPSGVHVDDVVACFGTHPEAEDNIVGESESVVEGEIDPNESVVRAMLERVVMSSQRPVHPFAHGQNEMIFPVSEGEPLAKNA
eukprot:191198_1